MSIRFVYFSCLTEKRVSKCLQVCIAVVTFKLENRIFFFSFHELQKSFSPSNNKFGRQGNTKLLVKNMIP